jgi:hypothetical protein
MYNISLTAMINMIRGHYSNDTGTQKPKYSGKKPRKWIYNRPLFTSQKISQVDITATVRFFALQNLVRGSGGGVMHRRTARQTQTD